MCGFVGFVRLEDGGPPGLGAHLDSMSSLLAHRGPDDAGVFQDESCGLAHRRLSVLDLSTAGHQPMTAPNGAMHLVYNGEIYNFRELRQQHGLGPMKSRTDTEVLLHLLQQRGIDATLADIDGMYAFAAWDPSSRQLHLARDPFGIKPLFYTEHEGVLWFASEVKSLLGIPGFQRQPDLEALHHYLSFDYIPGGHTAFRGIHELRPGHRMEIDSQAGTVTTTRFHRPRFDVDPGLDFDTCLNTARSLLHAAVERQLVADVPVGVMLSGGIDSSALVALTAEIKGGEAFHTFSLGFDDPTFDESDAARSVATACKTEHHEIRVTPQDVIDALPSVISAIDEPYADGSAPATWLLSQEAKKHVTVLLSGEGGDEVFSGYDTHAAHTARTWYRWIPGWIRRYGIAPLVHMLPVSHGKLSFDFKAKRFVSGVELDAARAHHAWRVVLSESDKRTVLRDTDRFSNFPPSNAFFADAWEQTEAADPLNRLLGIDRSFHLPDDLMVKNDRMTMAHSIEARVPFCDRSLVDFLDTVPVQHKMRGLHPKMILRTMMRDILPAAICDKKKMGLELPYSHWLRGPMHDMAQDLLSSTRLDDTGLFDAKGVHTLLEEHTAMKVDHGRALWGLLNYMVWHDLYIASDRFRENIVPARAPITSG